MKSKSIFSPFLRNRYVFVIFMGILIVIISVIVIFIYINRMASSDQLRGYAARFDHILANSNSLPKSDSIYDIFSKNKYRNNYNTDIIRSKGDELDSKPHIHVISYPETYPSAVPTSILEDLPIKKKENIQTQTARKTTIQTVAKLTEKIEVNVEKQSALPSTIQSSETLHSKDIIESTKIEITKIIELDKTENKPTIDIQYVQDPSLPFNLSLPSLHHQQQQNNVMKSNTVRTKKTIEPFNSKGVKCDGRQDPFKKVPVESFVPPFIASIEDSSKWTETVTKMKKDIAKLKIGGEPLRSFIRSEISRLEKLRMDLFCKYL